MMEFGTNLNKFPENKTPTVVSSATIYFTANNSDADNAREESIRTIQSSVASVGIIANLTVIVVFLNHKKLRRKIHFHHQSGKDKQYITVSSYSKCYKKK